LAISDNQRRERLLKVLNSNNPGRYLPTLLGSASGVGRPVSYEFVQVVVENKCSLSFLGYKKDENPQKEVRLLISLF